MYLKQLDIHGFKTFAEKTQVVFTPGVTCVIGPNGSGKSNISDAILWVLGENNVRSLRGSSAQDVIFAGNDRRRPLGMAEVSLTLDNSARILPLDFTEITITRRLYRSGESEFSINKVSCRLKDIYELFLDTGVGRDAYSMINQGQIDQVLSVRAEDRRALFEEAAGIKKYRVRKREAERKLEHTQQNLLRVNDIVAEIEARLGPLQRQAAAARRYREIAGRLRLLESAWYGMRLKRLGVEGGSLSELVGGLAEERKRLEAELSEAQAAEKRAADAIAELDRRAEALRGTESASLQKVAEAQAERVRAEERSGEVQRRLQALDKELEELGGRITEQVRRQEETAREEVQLKREVDAARTELSAAQTRAAEAGKTLEAAGRELETRRQAWLARARREAELEARVQSLEARVKGFEGSQGRAREAREDAEAELERLRVERESFTQAAATQKEKAAALTAEVEKLRETAKGAETELARARAASDAANRAHQSHTARLQALSELGERGEGAAAGAKTLLGGVRRGQVRGKWSLLVEGLRVPQGSERAVEAALGIYADALLCETAGEALAGLKWLRSQKHTALALPGLPLEADEPLPGSLGARVEGEEQAAAWARALLGRAFLVETLEVGSWQSAVGSIDPTPDPSPTGRGEGVSPATGSSTDASALAHSPRSRGDGEARSEARTPNFEIWVTPDGQWRSGCGAVSGGPAGAESSAAAALQRRRELDRLREEAPALEAAATSAREAVKAAEAAAREAQAAFRERSGLAEKARLEHQAQLREADRRNGDLERARHRVERLKADEARVEREQTAVVSELERARAERAAAGEQKSESGAGEEAVGEAEAIVREREAARRAADAAVTELRVRQAGLEQRLQGAAAAARRAVEGGAFLDRQRAERLREQKTLTSEREQRALSFETLAGVVAEAEAAVAAARAELAQISEERGVRTGELTAARAGSHALQGRLRELMERSHRAEVELTAVNTQREALGRQWVDAVLSLADAEAAPAADEEEAEGPPTITLATLQEGWEQGEAELTLQSYSDPEGEIGRMRRQIRSLGAVNPEAVEQFGEAQERYEFLTGQRADLEAAREQLEGAIAEIDLASRETFMKAFEEIARHFDTMFKKLFGGGATELRLTDPTDVLETGIDIIVQPPGKKQQNLLLLSGGERALTAVAMLFALLTVRPSPFCVLDEVDAPLDESNVGRFINTLREFAGKTQFIVVTHNRGTMEGADTLYGVTMEERGVSKVLSCSLGDPVVAQVEAEAGAAH